MGDQHALWTVAPGRHRCPFPVPEHVRYDGELWPQPGRWLPDPGLEAVVLPWTVDRLGCTVHWEHRMPPGPVGEHNGIVGGAELVAEADEAIGNPGTADQ